jgi:hypothetical protein
MVLRMCRCRYWSRRWILQEILLANEVTIICGENDLSWTALAFFIQRLAALPIPHYSSLTDDIRRTIPFVMGRNNNDMAIHGQQVRTLHQLLVELGGTECAVLHDKVYSLLSLAIDGSTIQVDYGCSPEDLLYEMLKQKGWFGNDLRTLAMDLGVSDSLPSRYRHYKT